MKSQQVPKNSRLRSTRKTRHINTSEQIHSISTHMLVVGAPSASNQSDVLDRLLTKQAIYDIHGHVVAYEINPRMGSFWQLSEGNEADMRLNDDSSLIAALYALTEEDRQPRHPLLISIDARSLATRTIDFLPAPHIIFSLRIGTHPDSKTLQLIKQRQQSGFRLLIEQHENLAVPPALTRTLREARIDTRQFNVATLLTTIEQLRNAGIHQLMANHIGCHEMLTLCMQQKITLFSGDYCAHTPPPGPHPIEINRLKILELIDRVIVRQHPAEIAAHLNTDARLCYQLLAYLKQTHAHPPEITSIEQAVRLHGHDGLYNWLMLLLRTSTPVSLRTQTNLRKSLSRARFLHDMALISLHPISVDTAWLIGILSVSDQLLHRSVTETTLPLNLCDEISSALIAHKGTGGLLLELALATETGNNAAIETLSARCLVSTEAVNLSMVNALVLAEDTPF